MKPKYTRSQVPRSARPDAEEFNRMYLVKNVSKLKATYQIRLLAFKAVDGGTKLVLRVPHSCEFDPELEKLIEKFPKALSRENY